MRLPTNDAPVRYLLDEAAAAWLGLDTQLLITLTEFGVTVAWREHVADAWSAPIALTEVPR